MGFWALAQSLKRTIQIKLFCPKFRFYECLKRKKWIFNGILNRTTWVKPHFLLVKFATKIGKCKANWQKKKIISETIWVRLRCLWFNFLNVFEIENSMSVWWDFMKILNRQYGSNLIAHIASYSEFLRNIAKFNIGQTICAFDKWIFKFSKWTLYALRWLAWLI